MTDPVDPSTVLVRALFRSQVAQVVATLANVVTVSPFVNPVSPTDLAGDGWVGVRDAGDRKAAIGTQHAAFTTTVTLEISGRVRGTSEAAAQAAIDALGFRIEQAVLAAPAFIRLLQRVGSVVTTTEVNADGSSYVGAFDMSVECETFEDFDPTEINPADYPQLLQMDMHVDLRNVFDPTGDYGSTAAFPDLITDPPRTQGPDGRDEGRVRLNMVTAQPFNPLARLSVSGKDIIGPDGFPITLRGWNWGLWGAAQAQDGQDAVAQGANIVRVPLRWWGLYTDQSFESRDDNSPGNIDPAHLAELDRVLDICDAAGLWVNLFIDSQCGQNGLIPGAFGEAESLYCDPSQLYPNGRSFWADHTQAAKFIETWTFLADHVKDRRCIGIFEILVEPNPAGVPASYITGLYDKVMKAVRPVAPGIPFMVGGFSYFTSSIAKAYNSKWADVIYTADDFVPIDGTHDENIAQLDVKISAMTALRDSKNVPVFVQQTGVTSRDDPDRSYLNALLPRLNAAGLGWEWWEYRDSHLDGGGFGAKYPDGQGGWITKQAWLDNITHYFNGTTTPPPGA